MSIIVENITKLYGEQKALDNMSFEVKSGEIVGFLGPNGAGKSTMMKIITCFIPQSSGKVSVCGFDVEEDSIAIRKKVGYLPEHNPLYLDMYVKEYLAFIGGLHKIKNIKDRVAEMIDLTGLQVEKGKKIGALSKGYRQRVGLAQAMIHDPEVLVLDEPTTGLDPNQLEEIRGLIKKVGSSKTVMMSTHIMQEVEAVCDKVIIINKGIMVIDKPIAEIHDLSGSEQIIKVEFDKETKASELQKIDGVAKANDKGDNKWELEINSTDDVRPKIFNYAVQNELSVLELHKEDQKLESIFKELTSEK
ncbi:MAG: gliding motility-associated ABC transporter ATP-binding subunit GldA [Flavobacteriales bacterium]|nr:gliding motility-associated ABC transporter ATP-binding subunit GldA [Flavobacteriales bacterium]